MRYEYVSPCLRPMANALCRTRSGSFTFLLTAGNTSDARAKASSSAFAPRTSLSSPLVTDVSVCQANPRDAAPHAKFTMTADGSAVAA